MTARRIATGLAVAVLLAQTVSVGASVLVRIDANDTRSPLDIRRIRVTHVSNAHAVRIITHRAVQDAVIDGRQGWFRIGIDPLGSGWRRSVYVYVVDEDLKGVVTGADGEFRRFVGARRLAGDRFVVRVPPEVTGDLPYRFAVWSVWKADPCSREDPCLDWVPDTGTMRHGGAGAGS